MAGKASLINRCVDETLAHLDFIDKPTFYKSLEENYGIKPQEIGDKFEGFHKAIMKEFDAKHFEIERAIIRCLHQETKKNSGLKSVEIEAFTEITSIFSNEINENVQARKELSNSKAQIRRLEEKVKVYDDKLRATERLAAIGQTAGMVGHDIRNPLQAMTGDVYLIRAEIESEIPSKASINESLDSLEHNIAYVNKIVSDLQDYAKPLKPEYTLLSLGDLVNDLLKIVNVPKNITVSTRINVPPQIRGEATFLRRAMTNLINNSIQAMPEGGKLEITAFENCGKLIIDVVDSGSGIPDEVKPRMFEPMLTTKSKGQGFGLAVVKRLVEALGGKITFESESGRGTKFSIKLPL